MLERKLELPEIFTDSPGPQINAGTSNKRRGRLFYTWHCRTGVYLNPVFIRCRAFNRENMVYRIRKHFWETLIVIIVFFP